MKFFAGKQIIHPSQVTIVQDEFVPSRTVIRRAQRLIEEFNRQQKEGKVRITKTTIQLKILI